MRNISIHSFLIAAAVSFCIVPEFCSGQLQIIIEEIQSVPPGITGTWTVNERKYVVDTNTQIAADPPAVVGTVAVLEFAVDRSGKRVVTRIQALPIKVRNVFDGPYIFWKDLTTAEIITVNQGKVHREVFEILNKPIKAKIKSRYESTVTLDPKPPTIPKSSWMKPKRLLAISDLEGNYDNAVRFLQSNKVIDDDGHWNWGDGHLVLVGDLVDRGPMVAELMALVRRLEREARAAGGEVHYVLGNHEVMVMGGDLRYIHPKYHFTSRRIGIPYHKLHGPDSEIGRWWRTRNGVLKIGNLLFVHAGYSPLLDKSELTIDELNRRIRRGLPPARPTGLDPAANPVAHQHGPFWYRGYFAEHAGQWGKPTNAEMQKILLRHDVDHIVVGHTLVEQVGPLADTRGVIGIDIKWADAKSCQGLLQQDGRLFRLKMDGKRELLNPPRQNR